jgi:hypothetical protein
VNAKATSQGASEEAYHTVTANGNPAAFCLHVQMRRDKSGDYDAPGIAGGSYAQRAYVIRVGSRAGEC